MKAEAVADRLGIELAGEDDDALESVVQAAAPEDPEAGAQADTADVRDELKEDFSANSSPEYRAAALRLLDAIDRGLRTGNGNANHDPRNGEFASGYNADAEETKGNKAMREAIDGRKDVLHAMNQREVGPIDFRYGDSESGLVYLMNRRDAQYRKYGGETGDQIAMHMPRVIAHGTLHLEGEKAVIEFEGYRAILKKGFGKGWGKGKSRNHWLLNGYDLNPEKGRGR